MTQLRSLGVVLLAAALLIAGVEPGYAQADPAPLVVFVQGRLLDSAAMTDTGSSGVSELANVFRDLGARVEYVDLTTPIPEQAKVVVVVGPSRNLGFAQVIYLWLHLARGNSALFAFDPEGAFNGVANSRPRVEASGLASLLEWDYGVSVHTTFLAEPWFTSDTVSDLRRTRMLTYADVVSDPITDPLRRYGLPVWAWGARHFVVEPFGVGSMGIPLLYSDSAFGETAPAIFRTEGGNPVDRVELNIGADALGRLNVAVRADSTTTGSRVVLLGDSEMLKNGFGFERADSLARYPGNVLLAGRIAAWLLDIPAAQWPGLPAGYTWLAIDGDGADWDQIAASVAANAGRAENAAHAIGQARAFTDGDYLYLLVETNAAPDPQARIEISLAAGEAGGAVTLAAASSGVTLIAPDGNQAAVADAAVAIGNAIELRLPVRLAPGPARVDRLCVGASGATGGSGAGCLSQPLEFAAVDTRAPFDFALAGWPSATAIGDGTRVRSGPGTDSELVATVRDGTLLAALGRDADTSWIRVRTARLEGWIAAYLLEPGGDLRTLPVVTPDAPGG